MTAWLSYGGGVNSTALAILLCQDDRLKRYHPWRCVFADTGNEQDETYAYVQNVFTPFLARHGKELEVVRDKETVLERWQRLHVVGHRTMRSCTDHAKIRPITQHIKTCGSPEDTQLIGIDAGEPHRARPSYPTDPFPKYYPLVELDIDRTGCERIIRAAGLCVPVKSGCWHCPFLRKAEVIALSRHHPSRFQQIVALEADSIAHHPPGPGAIRAQWGERPATEWAKLAVVDMQQLHFFDDDPEPPCGCYDG